MSDGSRFASLAQRARSLLGTGDVAVVALDAGTAVHGAGGVNANDDPPAAPAPPVAPAPAEPEPQPEPQPEPEAEPEPEAPAAAANTEATVSTARAEERQRVADVFASDASKGKERAAACLLANPKLSADEIVALLPQMSGGAGDNVMLANLSANPDLKPGAETNSGGGADVAAGWNRTFARLGWSEPKN
jgi:outer membrane biosynthesis protein TonB